jgi:hypothetical protein
VCALALRAFDARRPLRSPLNRYYRHAARYDHPLAGANLAIGVQTAIGQPCEPGATGVRGMFHFLFVGVTGLDRFWAEARSSLLAYAKVWRFCDDRVKSPAEINEHSEGFMNRPFRTISSAMLSIAALSLLFGIGGA